jgi:hypothetical protein
MAKYAKLGAYVSWAQTEDRAARTAPARKAMLESSSTQSIPTAS